MQYNVINYSHHAVHDFLLIDFFYNWKFVPFDYLHPFSPPPPLLMEGADYRIWCLLFKS